MNKKKIEKIITHNIESNGDFNRIKDRINYKIYKKEKISFKEFILSKRVLRLVCPLLALTISIPFIPSFFRSKNATNSQVNMETSKTESSNEENSGGYSNEVVSSVETSASTSSASSSSSQCTFYISTIEVYGVIILNEDKKMFYTDEVYGYYNELNKGKEFTYTGLYEIDHLYNYDKLKVNDYCVASIVVDAGNSEFEVNDIYEIRIIEE